MTQVSPLKKTSSSKVKSQIYELATDKKTLIGRLDTCHIHIDKPAISGEHAFIFYDEEHYWVEDNKSSNGTRLNGLPITGKSKFGLNDVVRVGDYTFTLVCEFSIEKGGKFYYLEIRKIKKGGGASYPSTDSVKMTVDKEIKSKALEEFNEKLQVDNSEAKKESSAEVSKTSETAKKESSAEVSKTSAKAKTESAQAKESKKSDSKKAKEKKKSKKKALIAKLGAGVALKLKKFELSKQAILSRIKEIAILSVICHIGVMYLADTYLILGQDQEKEIKEIIMTLKDEEVIQDISQDLEVEQVEPELQDAAPTNLALEMDLDAKVTSSSEVLAEAMEDLDAGTVSVFAGAGAVGDVVVGRGQQGVRDAAFRKRVLGAKGRYTGVDIRATLIWNTFSDLDLYAVNPSGEDIFYGRKESGGGVLDIDKNATDPVKNPVENIIFQKAGDGDYIIQLKLFEARKHKAVPFKIEFVIFGDVFYYKGILSEIVNGQEPVDIVNFTCKDGKYRINSYINEKAPKKMPEVELDLLTP